MSRSPARFLPAWAMASKRITRKMKRGKNEHEALTDLKCSFLSPEGKPLLRDGRYAAP
jgi:hypothetical protein